MESMHLWAHRIHTYVDAVKEAMQQWDQAQMAIYIADIEFTFNHSIIAMLCICEQ